MNVTEMITHKCRWAGCHQPATGQVKNYDRPDLCTTHQQAYATNLRGPVFFSPPPLDD